MKNILVLLLLLLPCMVGANDLSVVMKDTIVWGGTETEVDTVYTPKMDIRAYNSIWFTSRIQSAGALANDTLIDTVWVAFQHSFDGINWTTHGTDIQKYEIIADAALDTFVNSSLGMNANKAVSGAWLGSWARIRFIYQYVAQDSDTAGIADEVYYKKFTCWILGKP